MPPWYLVSIVLLGLTAGVATLADKGARLRGITWWPIPVIVGSFGVSAAVSDFPAVALERTWSIAFFAVVFVAAQVASQSVSGRKSIVLVLLAVIAVIALDFWWQRSTQYSLVRDVRLQRVRWILAPGAAMPEGVSGWKSVAPSGSLGNANDQAVVPVLAPLLAITVPSTWAWCLYALGAGCGAYLVITGLSRQVLIGLSAGFGTLLMLRSRSRLKWWIGAAGIVVFGVLCLIQPDVRARVLQVASAPLGDRGLPIAYAVAVYLANPILGVGPSLFGHYYVKGIQEGWTFMGEPLVPVGMPWVHCLPVEIACELGSVGVVAFGSVLYGFVSRLRSAFKKGGEARVMAAAVTASALSMAVMALIDLTFIKEWVRICWWLVLGLGYVSSSIPVSPVPHPVSETS